MIAMVLSLFGARLIQLQGVDPQSYAAMAASEGAVKVPLLAERGDIVDRNGIPLADSVKGKMVVANPQVTAEHAPELAKALSESLDIDYFKTLAALRGRSEERHSGRSGGGRVDRDRVARRPDQVISLR